MFLLIFRANLLSNNNIQGMQIECRLDVDGMLIKK